MSGAPNQAQIFGQWTKAVDALETLRAAADGLATATTGEFDLLEQALHGTFTPALANDVANLRASLSDTVSPSVALSMLEPIMREYSMHVIGIDQGKGYDSLDGIMEGIRDYFVANTITVGSRAITYDATPTAGGSNIGDGTVKRLTVDEDAEPLEACYAEKKFLRCRQDQNSGTKKYAESFEVLGDTQSVDNLLRNAVLGSDRFGTGESQRTFMTALNAGTSSDGGSVLKNASFQTYSATATPVFSGWDLSTGTAPTQNTTTYFRTIPGSTTGNSAQFAASGKIVQTLTNMRLTRFDPNVPYYARLKWRTGVAGSATGTIDMKLGSNSASQATVNMETTWQTLALTLDKNLFLKNFNEASLDFEIDVSFSTGDHILIDDVILAPMTLIDGTWWAIDGGATGFLVDDTFTADDSVGGLAGAANGIIQYWLWVAGLGSLPSTTGTPTVDEPT